MGEIKMKEPIKKIDGPYFDDLKTELEIYTFGELVAKLRNDLGLTAGELAKKSYISRPYISQIENDHRIPQNKAIEALADGLASSIVDDKNSDIYKKLFKSYRNLLVIRKDDKYTNIEKVKQSNSVFDARHKITEYRDALFIDGNLISPGVCDIEVNKLIDKGIEISLTIPISEYEYKDQDYYTDEDRPRYTFSDE